ncbi:unnamed protein product [Echinostoma caproni]|uniref:Uncharacterized protein n=1 Tax=Echinostoma caproni TaxID=27848 RepID=A0A183A403_9TREM|nr:unnamed protein product [Echinostoma caproni]
MYSGGFVPPHSPTEQVIPDYEGVCSTHQVSAPPSAFIVNPTTSDRFRCVGVQHPERLSDSELSDSPGLVDDTADLDESFEHAPEPTPAFRPLRLKTSSTAFRAPEPTER